MSDMMTCRLSRAERKALIWLARKHGLSRSSWVRSAIRKSCRAHGAPAKLMRELQDDLTRIGLVALHHEN